MTHISYLAGLNTPVNEWKQRGALVPVNVPYIPYTQMTKGELRLALALQNLQIDRSFYPESKELKQAAQMVENALYGGVNRGVSFVGAIGDNLQPVARLITDASRENAPASKYGMLPRNTPGIRIGDPIIPAKWAVVDCGEYARETAGKAYNKFRDSLGPVKKALHPLWPGSFQFGKYIQIFPIKKYREMYFEEKIKCEYNQAVENILNANLEKASPHLLYHNMRSAFKPALGTLAQTKRLLHKAGVSDIARVAGFDNDLMSSWVETGIKRDVVARGISPNYAYSSVLSAMIVPGDPEKWATEELAEIKKRGGAQAVNAVIATVVAITALVTAITAALAEANKMQQGFNAKKINALQNAQGFGTSAFQPETNDFLKDKSDTTLQVPGGDTTLLLGSALVAYLLLKK